jgi:hypothetical protein
MRRTSSSHLCLVLLLFLALPAAARAAEMRYYLPAVGTLGLTGGRGSPIPAAGSAALLPNLGVGKFGSTRFGLSLEANYANPGWRLAAGPRLAQRVYSIAKTDIALSGDVSTVLQERGSVISGLSFYLNVGDICRTGVRYRHSWSDDENTYEVLTGLGIIRMKRLIFPTKSPDPFE